jgi:hypothetical protein
MPSDVVPGRRSKTPHPALSKPRYDQPQAQAHRERKSSVVNSATDGMVESSSTGKSTNTDRLLVSRPMEAFKRYPEAEESERR